MPSVAELEAQIAILREALNAVTSSATQSDIRASGSGARVGWRIAISNDALARVSSALATPSPGAEKLLKVVEAAREWSNVTLTAGYSGNDCIAADNKLRAVVRALDAQEPGHG